MRAILLVSGWAKPANASATPLQVVAELNPKPGDHVLTLSEFAPLRGFLPAVLRRRVQFVASMFLANPHRACRRNLLHIASSMAMRPPKTTDSLMPNRCGYATCGVTAPPACWQTCSRTGADMGRVSDALGLAGMNRLQRGLEAGWNPSEPFCPISGQPPLRAALPSPAHPRSLTVCTPSLHRSTSAKFAEVLR